jgi:hypothetical protein
LHGEGLEDRRERGHVVRGPAAQPQVVAVHGVLAGFASRPDLQRDAHRAAAHLLHVSAFLYERQQDVVALKEHGHLRTHLFELQSNALRIR